MDAPERIYLQRWTSEYPDGWSWCIDRIDGSLGEKDDPYVRGDLYAELERQNAELERILTTIRNLNATHVRRCEEHGARNAELEERVAVLEGGFRLILLEDYRGPKSGSYRIAEEVLAAGTGGPTPLVVWNPPEEVPE